MIFQRCVRVCMISERLIGLQKKMKRLLFKEHYHQGKSDVAMARESKHVGKYPDPCSEVLVMYLNDLYD